jgi:hypothetical protein
VKSPCFLRFYTGSVVVETHENRRRPVVVERRLALG